MFPNHSSYSHSNVLILKSVLPCHSLVKKMALQHLHFCYFHLRDLCVCLSVTASKSHKITVLNVFPFALADTVPSISKYSSHLPLPTQSTLLVFSSLPLYHTALFWIVDQMYLNSSTFTAYTMTTLRRGTIHYKDLSQRRVTPSQQRQQQQQQQR